MAQPPAGSRRGSGWPRSPREREVALAVGQLDMSLATVKAHISRLLTKLGAANRVQIALLVHDAVTRWYQQALAAAGLSASGANDYRESMPVGDPSARSQPHDLYTQVQATRQRSHLLAGQLRATRLKASENWQLIQAAWDQTERIRARRLAARNDPGLLQHSAYARLRAQLASMPVIEQAKGIIMARYGWPEDQAFEALRRASQRKNIKLRELAVKIVAQAVRPAPAPRQAGPGPAPRQAGPVAAVAHAGGESISGRIPEVPRDRSRAPA